MKSCHAVHVGCGNMSKVWLKAATAIPNLALVGLVDVNTDAAAARAREFELNDVEISSDLSALLGRLKPDVVFDCTVPPAHRSVTLRALEAGCHVLGEKPIADTMESAIEMVRFAKERGRIYAVIQNRRYARAIRTVKNAIESGLVGKTHTFNADFYLGPHFGGFREEMGHVLLLDMAIHSFDQARFLTRADPVSVYCHEYNPPSSWYKHGASAMAIFEMSDGSVFNYRGSWCAEGLPTSWQCSWRIIGEGGTLLWDGDNGMQLEQRGQSSQGLIHPAEPRPIPAIDWNDNDNGHQGIIQEFLQSVEAGSFPMTHGEDNIKSLAMVFGAIESAKAGAKLPIQLPAF